MTAQATAAPVQRNDNIDSDVGEKGAENAFSAEQNEQEEAGDDWRHHQRQMDGGVEDHLAWETPAREHIADKNPKRKAGDCCRDGDLQRQPDCRPFRGR